MLTAYDGVVCDLDGVVYRGDDAVPGAPEALQRMVAHGTRVVYATNNASRVPAEVAAHLASLGAPAEPADIVTSAEAGAERVAALVPAGSTVLALGGAGVVEALTRGGLHPVAPHDAADLAVDVAAVLQGLGRDLTVRDFETAARLLTSGLPWVATNDDATLPLPWGQSPGNGAYVDLLATAAGRRPDVVGKPHPPLYRLALRRLSTAQERTLAVGDRLDTDIAGALATGIDSAWVLTGVDRPSDLLARRLRPTYVVASLAQLFEPYAVATAEAGGWRCGDAHVRLSDGDLVVDEVGASPVEAVRAGIAAFDGVQEAVQEAGAHGRTGSAPDGRRVGAVLDELLAAPGR